MRKLAAGPPDSVLEFGEALWPGTKGVDGVEAPSAPKHLDDHACEFFHRRCAPPRTARLHGEARPTTTQLPMGKCQWARYGWACTHRGLGWRRSLRSSGLSEQPQSPQTAPAAR